MNLLTDRQLERFRTMEKRITNPDAQWNGKPSGNPSHWQRSFTACSKSDEKVRFEIYQRKSIRDKDDFAAGIAVILPNGARITLARYDGISHDHGDLSSAYLSHVHRATEKAMRAGRKPESRAESNILCENEDKALLCLLENYHIPQDQISTEAMKWP